MEEASNLRIIESYFTYVLSKGCAKCPKVCKFTKHRRV